MFMLQKFNRGAVELVTVTQDAQSQSYCVVARGKMMIKVIGLLFFTFLLPPYLPALALQCDSEVGSLSSVKALKQDNAAWCWAASTQIVMDFHNKFIKQCDIVNAIFQNGNDVCCGDRMFDTTCSRGGSPDTVFKKFDFNFNKFTIPPDKVLRWDQFPGQICNNGPFIFGVRFKDGGRHLFVVRGYRTDPDGERIVEVTDLWNDEFFDILYEEFVGDTDPESSNFGYTHIRDYIDIRR
jgi:Papain-like cysteine protease AvrRpt2